MRRAFSLESARRMAQPGEYIMTQPQHNADPLWCVMTPQEHTVPVTPWNYWWTWERKD